jgi:hypothetical protein
MAGFFKKRMLCPYRRATIAAEAMEKHAIIRNYQHDLNQHD